MKITENDLIFLRSELQKHIGGKRLAHSLAVEAEAMALGKLFGFSEEILLKLRCAAILHDITKAKNTEEQIRLCKEFGLPVSDDDIMSPKVFHSLTGAHVAAKLYPQYVDSEIFNAIKYHTTGRADMSLFEKLIYLADYIEETRDFPDCVELRRYFYSSKPTKQHLDRTLLLSFDMTIRNLLDEGCAIHKATVEARNFLVASINK